MNDLICQNCGCTEAKIVRHGMHTGAFCSACGKWIKWLNKDEIRKYQDKISTKKTPIEILNDIANRISEKMIEARDLRKESIRKYGEGCHEDSKFLGEEIAFREAAKIVESIIDEESKNGDDSKA